MFHFNYKLASIKYIPRCLSKALSLCYVHSKPFVHCLVLSVSANLFIFEHGFKHLILIWNGLTLTQYINKHAFRFSNVRLSVLRACHTFRTCLCMQETPLFLGTHLLIWAYICLVQMQTVLQINKYIHKTCAIHIKMNPGFPVALEAHWSSCFLLLFYLISADVGFVSHKLDP